MPRCSIFNCDVGSSISPMSSSSTSSLRRVERFIEGRRERVVVRAEQVDRTGEIHRFSGGGGGLPDETRRRGRKRQARNSGERQEKNGGTTNHQDTPLMKASTARH